MSWKEFLKRLLHSILDLPRRYRQDWDKAEQGLFWLIPGLFAGTFTAIFLTEVSLFVSAVFGITFFGTLFLYVFKSFGEWKDETLEMIHQPCRRCGRKTDSMEQEIFLCAECRHDWDKLFQIYCRDEDVDELVKVFIGD